MRMAGEQQIAASRHKVWAALNDPAVLQACIPGCQSLEKEAEDRFAATAEIKIGPIGARFKGAVTLSELDPPNGYRITGQGNGGIAGSAKGGALVKLTENAGGTLINYEVEAEVGGRMAQLGGPIIDATAKQLAGKFFKNFGEALAPQAAARAAPATQAALATPTSLAAAPKPAKPATLWLAAIVLALIAGTLIGSFSAAQNSAWPGLAIGLLIVIIAAAAFEYGRRIAAPVLTLDSNLLRRLLEGARE